jgi:hypothetical protein
MASMLNSTWLAMRDATEDPNNGHGGGAGSALNPAVLISAGVATFVATVVSVVGILFQLKVSDHRLSSRRLDHRRLMVSCT